jgi:putative tricarboxylic transport membrane protein
VKVSDLAAGLALAVLGLAFAVYGLSLPPMPGQRYGAGLFPMLLGLCFVLCGLQLAWTGWHERVRTGEALAGLGDWVRDPFRAGNFVLVLVLGAVYVVLSDQVGFIPLSIAILLVMYLRLKVPPLKGAIIALATTAVIQLGFAKLLRVPLPRGILAGVIW